MTSLSEAFKMVRSAEHEATTVIEELRGNTGFRVRGITFSRGVPVFPIDAPAMVSDLTGVKLDIEMEMPPYWCTLSVAEAAALLRAAEAALLSILANLERRSGLLVGEVWADGSVEIVARPVA